MNDENKNIIVEAIKNDIFSGVLKPGEKIVEERYAKKYAVSRTPIREAIRILASDFLLETKKNVGAVVRVYSPAQINELYALRFSLETLKYRSVLKHLNASDIAMLQNICCELESCDVKIGENVTLVNKHFNQAIHSLLKTPIIKEWLNKIEDIFRYLRNMINLNVPHRWAASVQEHIDLCRALIIGDEELMITLLNKHLMMSRQIFLEYSIEMVSSYK